MNVSANSIARIDFHSIQLKADGIVVKQNSPKAAACCTNNINIYRKGAMWLQLARCIFWYQLQFEARCRKG